MSADTSVAAYAQLAELELEFDRAEVELLKQQITLFTPIYARRHTVLASIPSFWSIIFENFGPELDEHITLEDWAFLGENLTSVNIIRPDVDNNPRTFEIVLGLKQGNGVVEESEIRKRFVFRSLKDGRETWSGLVSEPVEVGWIDKERDLSGGINDIARRIFELRKKRLEDKIDKKNEAKIKGNGGPGKVKEEEDELNELELELEEKLNQTQSFFSWFSWMGEYFMVMERDAERERRAQMIANGEEVNGEEDEDEDDDDHDETDDPIDVFPDGEKLAYLIAEDMFPNALKHFADAMEHNEPAIGDTDDEDAPDFDDAESIELDSDLEQQLHRGHNKHNKGGKSADKKKKRRSDDEMEEREEDGERGKKKARK